MCVERERERDGTCKLEGLNRRVGSEKMYLMNKCIWWTSEMRGWVWVLDGGVRPGIQSEDQNQFFIFKVRTFWQIKVKISVLALWLGALSSLFHNMGVGGIWTLSSLCTCQACSEVCEKKCPHFECVIHRFVLTLNTGMNTPYTRVYIVSSLWMPGQVGVCVDV